MLGRTLGLLAVCLIVAAPAEAQIGGAGGGGHGGGRGGGGRGGSQPSAPKPAQGKTTGDPADKPANQIEIIGVITAIDTTLSRVTIAYDPVDELNWPKGVMPFPVTKVALLTDRKVGDKVRFKVDSHEIYELTPF